MSNRNINPQILNEIKKQCKGDNSMRVFLYELVYKEAENISGWWWKETYKELLKTHSANWSTSDED